MSETDEVKKDLYKEKPLAKIIRVNKDGIHYKTHVLSNAYDVYFTVPLNEIGDAKWDSQMPSQLLLRYMID